jgi:LAO/AO transport system kinase
MSLAKKIIAGDIRSAARLIRDIEDEIPSAREELKRIYPHTGSAHILGITGSPGSGKSTLVDKIVGALKEEGKTIGVVAVDPTSPFTDGALLGDRVCMQRHSTDKRVFIRSVATRRHVGGLSRSTSDIVDVLDAMGKDVVIVETVGVGQDEVEIVRAVHTTVVVLVPGMGDDVQAIKAGILEIGDIFVVNKADRDGADNTVREIEAMIGRNTHPDDTWRPVVLKTQANCHIGISELLEAIHKHRFFLSEGHHLSGLFEARVRQRFLGELQETLLKHALEKMEKNGSLKKVIRSLAERREDPYSQAEKTASAVLK